MIKVNKFTKSNLLHINLGKCCLMHFNPTTKCNTTNEEDENLDEHPIKNEHQQDEEILKINQTPIPKVSSTKFLGVTIDFLGYHTLMIYIRSLSQQQVCLNACVIISPKNIINHYTMLFLRAT